MLSYLISVTLYRGWTLSRSLSSFTILRLSMPLKITWCNVPSASNLGLRGIFPSSFPGYALIFSIIMVCMLCQQRPLRIYATILNFQISRLFVQALFNISNFVSWMDTILTIKNAALSPKWRPELCLYSIISPC